jgi:hypothetical protein
LPMFVREERGSGISCEPCRFNHASPLFAGQRASTRPYTVK